MSTNTDTTTETATKKATATTSDTFFKLHQAATPLVLVNIWDPISALLAQQQGAKAVGTSSAALAWALGYADGEQLPKDELLAAVRRLLRVCQVPLTVDIELGYSSEPQAVAQLVQQLAQLGVAGINLEDGAGTPELLCQKIAVCRALLAGQPLFINVRTDVFLRGLATSDEQAIAMCRQRFELYQAAGADGAFVPGLTSLTLAQELGEHIQLPLNLMGWPEKASLADLSRAKVQRISVGPAIFLASVNATQQAIADYLQQPAPAAALNGSLLDLLCSGAAI
jgi:2-methylisocitrate lyase-like PEP mutase family enzyme